jgi:hypothetical protein
MHLLSDDAGRIIVSLSYQESDFEIVDAFQVLELEWFS